MLLRASSICSALRTWSPRGVQARHEAVRQALRALRADHQRGRAIVELIGTLNCGCNCDLQLASYWTMPDIRRYISFFLENENGVASSIAPLAVVFQSGRPASSTAWSNPSIWGFYWTDSMESLAFVRPRACLKWSDSSV